MAVKSAGWLVAVVFLAGAWGAPAAAVTLSGEVLIEGSKRLRNLVVYMERYSSAATSEAARPVRIFQRGRRFSPGTIIVVQGSEVEFVNDEEREIDHNVYSLSRGNKFDIGLAPRGESRRVRFDTPGLVKYFCSVHKNMEGTVIVVPSPHFAVLKRPGQFRIKNVPAGDWLVKVSVAHRRYRAESVRVKVSSAPVDDVVVRMRRRR